MSTLTLTLTSIHSHFNRILKRILNVDEDESVLLSESFIDIDTDTYKNGIKSKEETNGSGRRSIPSAGSMVLEIEYHRELITRGVSVCPCIALLS